MLVGITYDLREDYLAMGFSKEETAELDRIETIEAIEFVLKKLGYETERIGNIKNLVNKLAQGIRWEMVFNISEGINGISRESQVPALLDAYCIPYTFSDPLVLALSLHKGMAKSVIRDLGIPTPRFAVIGQIDNIYEIDLAYPLFVKPVAEGTSKGIDRMSKVHNADELERACIKLLGKFRQPVLVEEYLPGREFTVGIVGTGGASKITGVMEIIIKGSEKIEEYSYNNKINYIETVTYKPVTGSIGEKCSETALKVWRGLGCMDGGRVDLKMDSKGILNFMEVNPLAGLNPVVSDFPILSALFGMSYEKLIRSIMESSLKRLNWRTK
jgi:D-alanine-D-alanine ligase